MLQKYCTLNQVQILRHYHDDHSAKTFERPQFQKLLMQLRKEKGVADMLLFTKWDRFSRNAADAYGMLKTLHKLGVDPQAIEQPLDLDIPENKIMLAFYLAAPEVENHRRALNVSGGMHRAMKEGRFMGKAPFGYCNRKNEKIKWIEPEEKEAAEVREIFESLVLGKFSAESVLKFTRAKGYRISKNAFWNMIRNPLYAGKIKVPAYRSDPEQLITGQHQPLISEALFHQVQDMLTGKRKQQKAKKKEDDRFPLRGFLECHADGRLLTASASVNRYRKSYEYYHCTSSCGVRHRAITVNDAIVTELKKWAPHPAVKILYGHILQELLSGQQEEQKFQLKKIQEEMSLLHNRRAKARELLLTDAMASDDYKIIRNEAESRISRLEAQVAELATQHPADIAPQLERGMAVLENIGDYYSNAGTTLKRDIISSIFPEKLVFDGQSFRTSRVNEAVQMIFNLGAAFSQIKTGQSEDISSLSREVIPLGRFSNLFLYDLRKLANLYTLLKAG